MEGAWPGGRFKETGSKLTRQEAPVGYTCDNQEKEVVVCVRVKHERFEGDKKRGTAI